MAMSGERQPLISSREIVAAALKGEEQEEDQDMLEADSGEMQQFRAEAAVLQALPLPLQLIALATRYLAAAHALSPEIAERPTSTDGQYDGPAAAAVKLEEGHEAAESDSAISHADYISAYRRYISASLTCCRAVVDGGKDPATRTQDYDVRYELRARAMLAELLVRETNDVAEAELHITKGLTAASKHPSFTEYRYRFLYLQVELAISLGNSKFAKQTVRKSIKELSELDKSFIPWLYRFHFLHVQIIQEYEQDYRGNVAALLEVAKLARSQEDHVLHWILQMMIGRLAFLENDTTLAATILPDLAKGFSLPMTEKTMLEEQQTRLAQMDAKLEKEERGNYLLLTKHTDALLQATLPRALVAQFLVLLSVYQAYIGEGPVAKQTVKRAHTVLDEPEMQPGQAEGWIRIAICHEQSRSVSPKKALPNGGSATSQPSYLYLGLAPKSLFYAYTFLVSTVIQIDPSGKMPRCLAYAAYGMSNLNLKVRGTDSEVFSTPLALADIGQSIRKIARMQADLMLYQVELYIMRSSFFEARMVIADLVIFLNSHDLWNDFSARVYLARGMVYHSLGVLDAALDNYLVACNTSTPKGHLSAVSRASILLVRLAQGYDIRLSNDGKKAKGHAAAHLLPIIKTEGKEDGGLVDDYDSYVRTLLEDCHKGGPMLKLMGLLMDALTNAEIVRAKACLKAALQLSNQTNNQHVKPLILALLASYFNHTENEQAQKMLHSAHTICRSMSGHHAERQKSTDKKERVIGRENVGMLLLGLWTSEELLKSYEQTGNPDKARKQALYNKAHEVAISFEKEDIGLS